jgi:phytoene synthase
MSVSTDETFCADLVRTRDFVAYAASLFVPPPVRRGWLAVAAFNAEVAHVRDHVSQPLPGEIRLQWWRDLLSGEGRDGGRGDAQASPVAAELMRAVAEHGLPVETLVRLIDAHVFDVYDDPMPDIAALEAHCRDTAAALYALRARIAGTSSGDVTRAAEHAGIADGLVDAMLLLPRHAARHQLYLPGDLMAVHNVAADAVFRREAGAPLNAVLAHLRGEARTQMDAALAMLGDLPRPARASFLPLAMTRRTLRLLESADPFAPPLPSRLATLWTLWRAASRKPFKA